MMSLPRRSLGATGLEVSVLGLGTVKLGRNTGIKYPAHYDLPTDKQAANLLAMARQAGINLLDTAPAYGNSEERLGQLLKGQRDDWLLCTKVGEEFDGENSHFDFSAVHTRQSIERSLRRLGTDHLDLVLVHSSGADVDIIENTGVLDALQQCRQAGLIRAFGMSTKTLEGGLLAARETDCVMLTYNPAYREEEAVIDECRRLNKGVLLKKVLASGHLWANPKVKDPLDVSLRFIFAKAGISSAIIGTITPRHLADNIARTQAILAGTPL